MNGNKVLNKKLQVFFLKIGIAKGLLFIILSILVNKDIFRNLDYESMVNLQQFLNRNVDLPFSILTLLGSSEISLSIIGVIFLLILWSRKHLFSGLFLIFSIYVVELAGKILIYHPKPPVIFNRYVLNIFFPSSFIVQTSFSYPSGHMARVTFLSVILLFFIIALVQNKLKKIIFSFLIFTLIILMFVSRIYLGEHWLSDVLGGLLLGSSLATLAIGFW